MKWIETSRQRSEEGINWVERRPIACQLKIGRETACCNGTKRTHWKLIQRGASEGPQREVSRYDSLTDETDDLWDASMRLYAIICVSGCILSDLQSSRNGTATWRRRMHSRVRNLQKKPSPCQNCSCLWILVLVCQLWNVLLAHSLIDSIPSMLEATPWQKWPKTALAAPGFTE